MLKITKPEPETLLGREAHERVRAILAETIDEHLWRVLRIRQGSVAGQVPLADATTLTRALDSTAGNGSSPDEESTLYSTVREECSRYYTERGLARKPLKLVVERESKAVAEEQKCADQLEDLEADIARRAELEARLREIKTERREAEDHADQRESEFHELEKLKARVDLQPPRSARETLPPARRRW